MTTIVVTGPESTGKTELCKELAKRFNTVYIPEYARGFIESLNRPYQYDDIENIAHHQVEELKIIQEQMKDKDGFIFVDTYLIITKVWFLHCYGKFPNWLDNTLINSNINKYLLCKPDIAWVYDPVRENGSDEQRQFLYDWYKREIAATGTPYVEVCGEGEERIKAAIAGLIE